jgi:hypothetical protein
MASVLGTFPIAVRGRQKQREPTVTKRIPSCPRSITDQAMPLGRQIGEHHWWSGVAVLEANCSLKEILVCTHYSGWRYVLARTKNPNVFVKLTYYNDRLQPIVLMTFSPWGASDYDGYWLAGKTAIASYIEGLCINLRANNTNIPTYSAPLVRCASC